MAVQQAIALTDIMDIGRCADDGMNQTRIGIDPNVRFHAKGTLVPFLVWCISGLRALRLFLVELRAAISVTSTTVPVLSIKPLALKGKRAANTR